MPYKDPAQRKQYMKEYLAKKEAEDPEAFAEAARKRAREYAARNRDQAKTKFKQWYYEQGGREKQLASKEENSEHLAVLERHARISRKYGLSPKQYEAIWEAQEGKCAICGTPEEEVTRKRLSVDHCHKSNKVRALLCHHCNCMLGYSMENLDRLEKAIQYLKAHN